MAKNKTDWLDEILSNFIKLNKDGYLKQEGKMTTKDLTAEAKSQILAWVKENVVVDEDELFELVDGYHLRDKAGLRLYPSGWYLSKEDSKLLTGHIMKHSSDVIKIKESKND